MKYILLSILLFTITDPLKIGKINTAKAEARKAYTAGDYKTALKQYRFLVDSMDVQEDEITLNLANTYFHLNDTSNALTSYQSILASEKNAIRSKAQLQLGILNYRAGNWDEALANFKQAIKAEPANTDARYNYEMLKKKLDEKKKQEEDDKKNNKNNKDENKKDEPSDFAKKLKQQADQFVLQRKYRAAYNIMTDGLKKDKTVSTYQDYIKRVKDIVEINGQ